MPQELPRAGVIGWPVAHSLSPKLHTYWLEELQIDGEYVAMPAKPEDLGALVKSLPDKGFLGANLTIPHKEAVIPLLDSVDEVAMSIGAVNTIVIKEGRLHGMNTDAYGFMENIKPHLRGRQKAVVLGAGGAAKSVCHALVEMGFFEVVVLNRTVAKSVELAKQFKIKNADWDKRSAILASADLLVNTTSLGLAGNAPLDIDFAALPKEALVTDIVYKPLMTPLLAQAQARGNPIVDGLGMLIWQAVPAFEAWFGQRPLVTDALRHYLVSA